MADTVKSISGTQPWRKVLYEKQGYPDNYTDNDTFLRDLRKNIHFQEVTYLEAILGATLLLQEFCTVIGFVLIYVYLYNEWIQPDLILNYSCILTLIGFLIYRVIYTGEIRQKLGYDLRTVLIFVVFGQLFSPVLHTLTDTISTDSIYTMTFLMMIIHLIFFDYGVNVAIVSNSLSLSASVFASVCLASRLASAYQAFIFITIAVECFVLFPFLRNKMQKNIFISLFLLSCDIYFLVLVSEIMTLIFILTVIFINVVCPVLFVQNQRYKENIYGPWDEAVVEDADDVIYSKY